jgi:Raf kinase inhibitor-like YbhB/YbcL family protein
MRMSARATLVVLLLLAGCGGGEKASAPLPAPEARLALSSPAFGEGSTLPVRYTCAGEGVSPPLAWADVPADARELTLVVEDPDAGRFVHWTVLKIDPASRSVAEGAVPAGGVQTRNSFGKRGWGAACPPKGASPHRYVFALYASREPLGLGADATPDEVRGKLAKLAVARGVLTVHFGR